jgi:Uma2 family endonuclease
MSSILTSRQARRIRSVPQLYGGDRLTQAEFHRRYVAYPEDMRFELIEGTVIMASPVGHIHARYHAALAQVLSLFAMATNGVELAIDGTVILDDETEIQPDTSLRVIPECGGQTTLSRKGQYLQGAPEWIGEIAHSSVSIDLHQKKIACQRAGVHEYLVLCVDEQQIQWFNFKSRRQVTCDDLGIFRSRTLPGLWIDGEALLARDGRRLTETLTAGLQTREHAEFIRRLQAARKGR